MTIKDDNGIEFPLFENEYWVLAPVITKWNKNDGLIHPYSFATMLHNAKKSKGILPPLKVLLHGIHPKVLKSGNSKKAELLIEEIRKLNYSQKPSRLESYFLNIDKDVAKKRAKDWGWENKALVRCYIMMTTGNCHYANIKNYENLVLNPSNKEYAHKYWEEYIPNLDDDTKFNLEILADCGLYFPDWETFPELDKVSLSSYNKEIERIKSTTNH